MEMFNTTEKRMNELVFENRNKSYGAYVIRSEYDNTVTRSLGIIGGVSALLMLISFICSGAGPEKPIVKQQIYQDSVFVIPIEEEEKQEEQKKEETAAPKADPADVAKVIKDDAKEEKPDPIKKEDAVPDPNAKLTGKEGGTGTSDSAEVKKQVVETITVKKKEAERAPDQMPELTGLYSILSKSINYPQQAVEAGISGMVIVNFVIDEEGNLEKCSIVKGLGFGCDEEALRVVKLLPKWKPGIKNGEPVKVTFNLPIRFSIK
jgi:protein TonB